MKNLYGSDVLVTGASSGIGLACARALAQQGCRVVGVSRHCEESVMEFPGGGSLQMRRMDVTDKASISRVVDDMERIDVAVLAAGMGVAGAAEELPMELARRQMEVNYFGALQVGAAVLPRMRRQKCGLFLVVGSIAGRVPIPMQSHYSSSKYALEAYVEAVRMEMRPFGVRAVILEPGDTRTGFTAQRTTHEDPASPYFAACRASVGKMERDEQNGRSPDSVAKAVCALAGRKDPPVRVAIGGEYRLLMFLLRFLPDRLKQFILTRMYLPVPPK